MATKLQSLFKFLQDPTLHLGGYVSWVSPIPESAAVAQSFFVIHDLDTFKKYWTVSL